MSVVVTSGEFPLLGRHGARLKELRQLVKPAQYRGQGLFLVEGLRVVEELLKAPLPLRTLLIAERAEAEALELARRARACGAEVLAVDNDTLERLAPANSSQGLLAWAERPVWASMGAGSALGRVWAEARRLLVLDKVQDPGNVGTLMRSALALGMGGVVLLGGADPLNTRAVRSSAGACFYLPYLRIDDEESQIAWLLGELERLGFSFVTALAHGGTGLWKAEFPAKSALVMGSEVSGVSAMINERAALGVQIPLMPQSESLNVAAAGSILMYEMRRRDGNV